MKAVIYLRSSKATKMQRIKDLTKQLDIVQKYCHENNIIIDKLFTEVYSEKREQPVLLEMLKYAEESKGKVKKILFSTWDRFSRDAAFAIKTIRDFNSIGINIASVEHPIKFNTPESYLEMTIMSVLPELESIKHSKRVKEGIKAAKEKKGRN